MRNIKLEIEYDGMNFYGWEIQPHKRTVRGVLESELESILQEKIKLTCGARTDTGVHAISQIANFKTETKITPRKLKQALLHLPQDVCVKSVNDMPLKFNAHFDAVSRTYLYKLVIGKSPIRRYGIWEYKFPLDIERIKSVLPLFLGKHRFDFFASKDEGECDIKTLKIVQKKNDNVFEICADHFLRKMIRLIVGTLTEFGRGYLREKDIQDAIDCKKNARKFLSAPPQGLYLKEIKYK